MSTGALFLKALPADEVVDALALVGRDVFAGELAELRVATNVVGLDLFANCPGTSLPDDPKVTEFKAKLAGKSYVVCSTAFVKAAPNQQHGSGFTINYISSDAVIGQITLSLPNPPADGARVPKALEALDGHFRLTPYVDSIRFRGDTTEQAALQMRERSVADLERQVDKLATFLASLTEREAEARTKQQADLESAYQQRTLLLDKAFLDKSTEADGQQMKRDAALDERRREFEAKVAAFDTRESKVARRTLLSEMKAAVGEAEKVTISAETTRKRRWIHGFSWLLMAVSVGVATTLLFLVSAAIGRGQPPSWVLTVPLSAASATFVTTVVYYLKWNDRWFREHADAEFAARRYKADILRASWLAELIAELATDKVELPPDLLKSFTRDLFARPTTTRVSEHPLDGVADLVKDAQDIQIGNGTFRLSRALGRGKPEPAKD
jgi:hypothetical protein